MAYPTPNLRHHAGRPEPVDLGLGRLQARGRQVAQVGHRRGDVGEGQFGDDEAGLEAGQGDAVGQPDLGVVPALAAEELILRRRAAEDRRRHIVELTAAGGERLAAAEKAIGAAEDDVLGALDDRQREQLFELLQQATAGRAPDCAGAAAEREEPEGSC